MVAQYEKKYRLNLYNVYRSHVSSKETVSLQYDCLYYNKNDATVLFEETYSWVHELIAYCIRPNNQTSIFINNQRDTQSVGHKIYTFDQLKALGISTEQLFDWSVAIDTIEHYQIYLDNDSTDNLTNASDINTEYFIYNCTPPWFGSYCQYSLGNYQITLEEHIRNIYDQAFFVYSPPPPCYMHLNCNRGSILPCLDWREICDGKEDCLNGEDEEQCWKLEANQCNENEYRCHNGQCIPVAFYKDGILNPDCMDRTDELKPLSYPTRCAYDPTFRCEESSCYPTSGEKFPFACGDGECVALYESCKNKRLRYAQIPTVTKNMKLSCSKAMSCLTGLLQENRCVCSNRDYQISCAILAKAACPSNYFIFPETPVVSNHVYLAYIKPNYDDKNKFIEPAYICFDQNLCTIPNTSIHYVLERTCIDYHDEFGTIFPSYPGWTAMLKVIQTRFLIACTFPTIQCPQPSMYRCNRTSKCISTYRLRDGVADCGLGDDENYMDTCSLNETSVNRFKCSGENLCLSILKVHDGISDCFSGEDELPSYERFFQNHITFGNICDEIQHMHPIEIDGRNETDETECDQWFCQNDITICNNIWNCPKGEDELECLDSPINCPPYHHPCISPNCTALTCLSIEKVNDGNIDCLGGSDERQLCRSMYPWKKKHRYHCWNRSECVDVESFNECKTKMDTKLWNIVSHASFCNPASLKPIEEHLCRLTDLDMHIPRELISSYNSHQINNQFKLQSQSVMNVQDEYYSDEGCHRGLFIDIKTSIRLLPRCLCPPSAYGDFCQYQNQRVSLTVQARSASDWRRMFTFVFLLITDQNEIESYDHRYYIPIIDCALKWNINLLYGSRPKDAVKNYSVRIYVYKREAIGLEYRASWHYPLTFSFLPVYRLAVQITIPSLATAIKDSRCPLVCNRHGTCIIANRNTTKQIFLCRCEPGWNGIHCQYAQKPLTTCSCAPGSLCINSYPTSLCLCPLGIGGPNCFIKINPCATVNQCTNGGQCVPHDERERQPLLRCACRDNYHGINCELRLKEFVITFHHMVRIPSLLFLHIFDYKVGEVKRVTLFGKIHPYETSLTIRTTVIRIGAVYIEFEGNYYLISLERDKNNVTNIHVVPEQRCKPTKDLFNSSFVRLHLLRRIKYYHVLCQNDFNLTCFYDEIHMCICDRYHHASCISFEHNMTYTCQDDTGNCENGGKCFQDDPECPSLSICHCPDCFHGSKCQFSSKGFSLSLDNILGYQIRPNPTLQDQLFVVKFSIGFVVVIFFIGILNGFLSIMVFAKVNSRKVGSGLYLLTTSLISILTIILIALKLTFLLLTQMTYITNKTFLLLQCVSIDFLLRVCVNYGDWLSACVAIERALTAIQGVSFNKDKSKRMAKRTIIVLFLLISTTNLHDPISRHLITDEDEQRTWCTVRYSKSVETYNSVSQILHFALPFSLNIIFAFAIIINIARIRARAQQNQEFKKHIREQLSLNKHLLISPIVIVLLAVPRLIISLISGCMKSDREPWLPLIGYFISFIPSLLIFVVFVLPSKTYKTEFKKGFMNFCRQTR